MSLNQSYAKTILASLLLILVAIRLPAQQEMVLKITGMDGEFPRTNLKGWIEIESMKHGVNFSFNPDLKSTVKGDPSFKEITLSKRLDKASIQLMAAAAEGKALYEAEILVLTDLQGKLGPATTLMRYHLRGVMVTSYSVNAEGKMPLEELTIRFRSLEATYRPGTPDENVFRWEGEEVIGHHSPTAATHKAK